MPAKAKLQHGKAKPGKVAQATASNSVSNGIRGQYEAHGVQGYYESYGEAYRNPHFNQILKAMRLMLSSVPLLESEHSSFEQITPQQYEYDKNVSADQEQQQARSLPLLRVLDLACGSGEATLALEAANQPEEDGRGKSSH